MRSWLFVPGDSEKKLAKAPGVGADALIIDLEDSVGANQKPVAREMSQAFLQANQDLAAQLWVRVNALDTGLTDRDLESVIAAKPFGIMLPKSLSGSDVVRLDAKLTALEALHGLKEASIRISVVATETAASLFTLGTYAGSSSRLDALTWGAEDLSADLGSITNRDAEDRLTGPYELARTLCLAGAVAAEVQPIDSVYVSFANTDGLRDECLAAVRDGFTGKMAIHPAQVEVINDVFTPSKQSVERAQRIADVFAEAGDAGVIGLDGEMLDRPHLNRAEKLLKRAKAYGVS